MHLILFLGPAWWLEGLSEESPTLGSLRSRRRPEVWVLMKSGNSSRKLSKVLNTTALSVPYTPEDHRESSRRFCASGYLRHRQMVSSVKVARGSSDSPPVGGGESADTALSLINPGESEAHAFLPLLHDRTRSPNTTLPSFSSTK